MKAKNLIKVFTTSVLLIILAIFVTAANAETIEISGNGSGSNNSIQLNQNNSININQSNSADVSNSVNINSNTGGNSINGGVGDGSITTGNITNNVNINNQLNTNIADVKCKNCPSPTKAPTPTQKPGDPIPTTPPGVGDPDGDGGDGGDGDGGVGGPGGEVLGVSELAVTGDFATLAAITGQTAGIALMSLGALISPRKKRILDL
ncbi:MAG: hypothetical protein A3C30_04455 [Candidatus Levybacteria bacterium RIFCSPHIGHO2_02_FULL_40_18]|nr:MAG: hypothetical protein A2869_01545 [Candidatus Levybacteria bacterium RIFCSPHIGHO2_01_FULL_40_58]OGH26332.1 MAG: hypothetical protein A3C30_04455 [Candidatus Levybacteria bacterium RIFCSPHIGHO2_02_FULL_40_18]OGH31291.1 MAG: hypothetical protein A3E43_02710 [Candidatus Levybacteria bacterium RIFCSPHIGHO2_12_FULL_40_31]OGH40793.1 MAG: hypothetical protein A2894_02145 [Candidatus Levybacteria bacterium RIFCSPLOWO2_01_FULL_40_64]OGH53652.1 MAG: hypothetical protein A3G15_01210 [Candidatus Lev